jgi:hypothetical protein
MNDTECCKEKSRTIGATFIGGVGAFLIVGLLAWLVVKQPTTGLDAAAALNRKATRIKVEQEGAAELSKFSVDPNKENLARLSVERAMEVMVAEWGPGSADGRAKLLERLEASKRTPSFE